MSHDDDDDDTKLKILQLKYFAPGENCLIYIIIFLSVTGFQGRPNSCVASVSVSKNGTSQ